MPESQLQRLGRITHKILEDTERFRKGLMAIAPDTDRQTINRVSLNVALRLNGWKQEEAEAFATKEYPRHELQR